MKADLQPNLENEFVLIRPLKVQDLEPLYQVAKDPLIWEQHARKRYKRKEFEAFFKESMESRGALIILDKKNTEVIGCSRFKKLVSVDTAIEIGWTFLARKYWGGMYNTLIKSLMIDHALNSYEEIIFYVTKSNFRSQKAIEKIGGKKTSENKYQSTTANNHLTYRIPKDEWKQVRSKLLKNTGLP